MIHKMKIEAASSALMRAFGLLPSEQRFLTTFLQASSLSHAAASLDLSEETARTYLKRICSKLGVRRQIELASLMFGLSPPIRRKLAPVSGASI
jgi:DNA-binding CsgD family transcriptional regulator